MPGRRATPESSDGPSVTNTAPTDAAAAAAAMSRFHASTRTWFAESFPGPTAAQAEAWEAIAGGEDTLVVAPTGSGKTLAAFLTAIDQLINVSPAESANLQQDSTLSLSAQADGDTGGVKVVYISPLKALAADVDRNLRRPLRGITAVARRDGAPATDIRVGVRTGDTSQKERRELAAHPPDILITTPESLFLMVTSQTRRTLTGVQMVIVDEIHSLADSKRGAHLAVTLERLDALLPGRAQRVGLSATVRPLSEVARYLSGGRPVTTVHPEIAKRWDLQVVVPVEDMSAVGELTGDLSGGAAGAEQRSSIWPHVQQRLVELITTHTSTLVFANSRRVAERLTSRINEVWDEHQEAEDAARHEAEPEPTRGNERALPDTTGDASRPPAQLMGSSGQTTKPTHEGAPLLARAHHGSVSREQRSVIEEDLKSGRLPAVVATSSLELGIDMGEIDLVAQVDAPPSVANGLQRVGRAGHQVGAVSTGVFFPTHRADLLRTAVVVERMRSGRIEELHLPANPLDVLAQQIVAMCAMDEWTVTGLMSLLRRTASFAGLTQAVLESVLDMLSGRYPSEDFAQLRPRIVWDRGAGVLEGRPSAQRLAVTSGGTIPDRGLFGVFVAGDGPGRRVGELDEEMVYESRVGDVFILGTSSWRIEQVTHDQVLVSPAPGQPGRLPFWKGDTQGREAELGAAIGAFTREVAELAPAPAERRVRDAGLDVWAAQNLLAYLREQREATGVVPSDRVLVVERFRDELGDWQIAVHSPYGSRVHAPWALCIAARLRERFGVDVQAMHADDGIVIRLPDTEFAMGGGLAEEGDSVPPGASAPAAGSASFLAEIVDLIMVDPADVAAMVTEEVGGSALFAARFRECASRALLLPRHHPGARQALWQQRRRSAQLLEVASRYPEFPIVLEALRECLQDVFDVPALTQLLTDIGARTVAIRAVDTPQPSPMARSLLFGYVAQFLYEGDTPLAERRAAALSLDPVLLADLLGQQSGGLRELLDHEVVEQTENELQLLAPDRAARHAEDVAEALRRIGPLDTDEVVERTRSEVRAEALNWLAELAGARRIIEVFVAGTARWALVEDAGRLLDALGAAAPAWVPETFLQPLDDPLGDLVVRYARSHGPFTAAQLARRYGIGEATARDVLRRLCSAGRVAQGEFRPGGSGIEFCDPEVLRTIRRRSLARLRAQVEPVSTHDFARFLTAWHGITDDAGRPRAQARGADGLLRVIEQLAGAQIPASAVESFVFPQRVADYTPAMLDELLARGEVLWQGHGATAGDDGWISFHLTEDAPLTLTPASTAASEASRSAALLDVMAGGGGFFYRPLAEAVAARNHMAEAGNKTGPLADSAPGPPDDSADAGDPSAGSTLETLWELVWDGHLGNDTFAPVRALLAGGRTTHRNRSRPPRAARLGRRGLRGGGLPRENTPARAAGRWTRLPQPETDSVARALAGADVLLDRYGVVTRGSVVAEDAPGGFAAVYRVLAAAEDTGAVRRGYLVEHLGASQFGTAGAIDRLRAVSNSPAVGSPDVDEAPVAVVLPATDPANPYGGALGWPDREEGHRPGRKAGALVVLIGGRLAAFVERGGRTILTFGDEADWPPVARALAECVGSGRLPALTVNTVNGTAVLRSEHPLVTALQEVGFHLTPQGLRIRHA